MLRLGQVVADVRFYHGKDDTNASLQHANELAERMRGSRLRLHRGEGHISMLDKPIKWIVETLIAPDRDAVV
jgi:pimeloyl-ACP methyl ester carboxylesterase